MKKMTVLTALALALLAMPAARARLAPAVEKGTWQPRTPPSTRAVLWFDDMEGGTAGWTHTDNTVKTPHFHVDTYMAYAAAHSWWCGSFDYDADGGYGNGWDDRLNLPVLDVSGLSYPILSFAFRNDSEPGYDITRVESKIGGVFVPFAVWYDGEDAWSDWGSYGPVLSGSDNPVSVRFRFVSDGAFSDEDGLWETEGGAFMADNIRVFDYYGGTVIFYDSAETGGLCTASVPAPSGDYWHRVSRSCPAYSDPHCWWCGSDADTSLVPANLSNSLLSPLVDLTALSEAAKCTLRFMLHAEVPDGMGDVYREEASTDDGATWHTLGNWTGDFGQCDGWAVHGIQGFDISDWLPGSAFRFRLTFYSNQNGCGPGAAGGAGVMLDDIRLEVTESSAEPASWGRIKALFK